MVQPIRNLGILLLGLLGLHLSPEAVQANNSGVLCVNGVQGETESLRKEDAGCIDVLSWSWGTSNTLDSGSIGGGGSAGKAIFQDFTFVKSIDVSSEDLFRLVATGAPVSGAEYGVEYREYGDCQACQSAPYLTIRFQDAFFSSQSTGGSVGGRPTESVSLIYSTVDYCYRKTRTDGTLDPAQCYGWHIAENRPL